MTGDARYEEIPYPGLPLVQTHPDRLAMLGRLFGLPTADPATARVLEVGCGDGANLIPMAYGLPDATFTGIDASPSAIARAREQAAALGLDNVRFEEVSLADHAPEHGGVDYVIAHGVYSWVPAPLREALLALCTRALARHGVAYVSYNTYPGGRLRQVLREILAVELEGIEDPAQRLAATREKLATLRAAWTYDEGLATLGGLATSLIEASDALLYHDTLAPANTPLYFRDFVAAAHTAGLQFLAEAEFWEMQVGWLPHDVRPSLLESADRLQREQRLDFMRMRTFRQTLLCHASCVLEEVTPQRLADLAAAAPITASAAPGGAGVTFSGRRGQALTSEHPVVIAALQRLAEAWPAALPTASLWSPDAGPQERLVVCETLLRCFSADLVTLHCAPIAVGTGAAERPRASAIARLQARDGATLTNLRHEVVELDEHGRLRVALLDGSRDRAAVRAGLAAAGAHDDPAVLQQSIEQLARHALLVAE
ncbi:MAG TPA: class I SAM-dependent methyltransferase [Solirubrobacteraceae bacterium]|nr:class I SAM-dependent methyltransferase [Solirubrobacteraceae bacterium]